MALTPMVSTISHIITTYLASRVYPVFPVALRVASCVAEHSSIGGFEVEHYVRIARQVMERDTILKGMRREAPRVHVCNCLLAIFKQIAKAQNQHKELLRQFFAFMRRSQIYPDVLNHLISTASHIYAAHPTTMLISYLRCCRSSWTF